MATVDWKAISPLIDVIYSSLDDPHSCDEFSGDVAALRFPSEYGVDVEWRHADSMFLVRLFCGSFDASIVEERVASAKDVVDLVQTWLEERSSETTYANLGENSMCNSARDTVSVLATY